MIDFWRDRQVLVTGGAGFIGSNLVGCLLERGAHVRIVDNLERGRLEYLETRLEVIEFRQEDLRDPDVCRRACQGVDVVFHLASKVGGIKYYLDRPAEVFSQNLLMDSFVWQGAQTCEVPYYLYASSAHVYPIELQQEPDAALIAEDQCYPANPELSYGWAKLMGEKLIQYSLVEGSPTRASIVRIIGAFGPNQDIDLDTGSAIPVFIRRAVEYPNRQPFVVLGTGKETRSYCYVDDIVEGLLRAVLRSDEDRLVGPLNLGSEGRVSIADLVQEIVAISGKDIETAWDKSHPTVIWGQALDCSRARELLNGWEPQVSLREGLERCYHHIESRLRSQKGDFRA